MSLLLQMLSSNLSYVAYNAALELKLPDFSDYKNRLLQDAKLQTLISELQDWPGPQISSHKSAKQFFHKLAFLADVGFIHTDTGIETIIRKIVDSRDADGIPTLPMSIPTAFGGSGTVISAWMLCDAPTILYSLIKMGYSDELTDKATALLAAKSFEKGWGCFGSEKLGKWRGPGRKYDPCPYATLIMIKLLLLFGSRYKTEIEGGAECLLHLWEQSRTLHPYIFYMGTNFRKLKLPFIWYDILHVIEVLSQISEITGDLRFVEMFETITQKSADNGDTPESVYMPWKGWDFGQKKQSSEWMGFCIERINNRMMTAGRKK
ncbi:MAG: hypothetical protein HQ557_16095 [Bacteroidetes bacterium]|nr:hypothetical protein [Bacteroidota bacterium]